MKFQGRLPPVPLELPRAPPSPGLQPVPAGNLHVCVVPMASHVWLLTERPFKLAGVAWAPHSQAKPAQRHGQQRAFQTHPVIPRIWAAPLRCVEGKYRTVFKKHPYTQTKVAHLTEKSTREPAGVTDANIVLTEVGVAFLKTDQTTWLTCSHSTMCKLHLNKTPTKLPLDPLEGLGSFFSLWELGCYLAMELRAL